MRAPALAALLLAALLPAAPASAQDAPAPLLEDPAGDTRQETSVAGVDAPPTQGEFVPEADLVSLHVAEADDALTFVVAVLMLEGELVSTRYTIPFTWNGQDYRYVMGYFFSEISGGTGKWGNLQARHGDEWEWVAWLPPAVDPQKGTLSGTVPKVYVMDAKKRIPGRGDAITGIRVDAEAFNLNPFVVDTATRDHMPDDAAKTASFTFAKGDFSTGSLRLDSPERVRVSNGGSTTFVYLATLDNLGESEDEYALAIQDLPHGWNASVQTPVKVPPKSEKTVAVLASVPFAHDHGGFDAFNLTAQSTRDPGTQGRLRLGVLHTPIPQPAGHHNEIHLHAWGRASNPINQAVNQVEPFGWGYLNTMPERDATEAPHATPNFARNDGMGWWIPLSPALKMGLDFDVEKTGALAGTLEGGFKTDATLGATLLLVRKDGQEILLAEADPVKVSLDPNAKTPFALTLVPTPDADYVPHQPDQNLALVLTLKPEANLRVGNALSPRLPTADFKMTLPLNEYHDKLTGLAEATAAIELVAEGLVEKAGRPGTIMTYAFTLKNAGPAPDRYEIDLAGADSRHGSVVPRGVVELGSQETRRVTVAVSIPPNAAAGEELEVLLFVHSVDDPGKTAIARTKTTVSLGSDANPDESPVLIAARDAENGTPGPSAGIVLLALLGAALAGARRRAE